MNAMSGTITVLSLGLFCVPVFAQAELPTAPLRAQLEGEFRASTGLGFESFECTYPNGWPGSREFLCDAIDEENDAFFYRIILEEGKNEPRITTSQPVSQLYPEGLATLAQPGNAFLAAFAEGDVATAYSTLSPALQAQLGMDGLGKIFVALEPDFGTISAPPKPVIYTAPEPGIHQLDFSFMTAKGPAIGRFRLLFDAADNPQISAFLVTAEPGSELQSLLLSNTGKAVLTQWFDQPIQAITGPLDELRYLGDAVEVRTVLADGSEKLTRVEQKSTASDLDGNDYRFQMLDAETIVRMHLAANTTAPTAVQCADAVAPDGGSTECEITGVDGAVSRITLMRRGGQHRLLEAGQNTN